MRIKNVPDLLFIVDEFEEKSSRVLKLFETIESEIVDDGGESDEYCNLVIDKLIKAKNDICIGFNTNHKFAYCI